MTDGQLDYVLKKLADWIDARQELRECINECPDEETPDWLCDREINDERISRRKVRKALREFLEGEL